MRPGRARDSHDEHSATGSSATPTPHPGRNSAGSVPQPAIAATELGKPEANAAGEIDSRDMAGLGYRIGMKVGLNVMSECLARGCPVETVTSLLLGALDGTRSPVPRPGSPRHWHPANSISYPRLLVGS